MRIWLIGNFVWDRQESMLRFARLLEEGFRSRGHDVRVLSPAPRWARWTRTYRYGGVPKYLGYADKFLHFPRTLRHELAKAARAQTMPDVVHIVDHANAVYTPIFTGVRTIVTCHDLLQIEAALGRISEHRVTRWGARYQHWILSHLRRVPRFAAVSHATADVLHRLTAVPNDRITVIPNCLNYPFTPLPRDDARQHVERLFRERGLPISRVQLDRTGYVFNLGGGQWYKNRPGLLRLYAAWRAADPSIPPLVLAGTPLSRDHEQLRDSLRLREVVHGVGKVSETDLHALYSAADALLFPSLREGFGWPIAEAQACGCPVVTTERAPMTEVGGDAACYVDPTQTADAVQRLLWWWPRRHEMIEPGLTRAKLWAPDVMLSAYESLYVSDPVATPDPPTSLVHRR